MAGRERKIPVFAFMPSVEKKKEFNAPYVQEGQAEELITLLHGKITDENSMLGSAGANVPGSAGETAEITDIE